METLCRGVFAGRERAGRVLSSAIPSYLYRWIV